MTRQLSRSEADIQRACLPNGIYEYMPYRYIIAPSHRKAGAWSGTGGYFRSKPASYLHVFRASRSEVQRQRCGRTQR
jgi:hypothetical protein